MPSRRLRPNNLLSTLRKHDLLVALPEESLEGLLAAGVRETFQEGAVVVRQGEVSDTAILLIEGSVDIWAQTASNQSRLATVRAPALLGEIGVIADLARTATIRARERTSLLRIEKTLFNELADKNPQILRYVVGQLGARIRELNSTIGVYTTALAALEKEEFEESILNDLRNPPAELVNFAETFRAMAQQISLRQRHRNEMASAAAIQRAMLPAPLPDDDGGRVELFARMQPAREVGGDFYDAFFLDKDHLVVTVGDVSGKGVPASLFMAVCQTTLRMTLRELRSQIGDAVERANTLLEMENSASMFATFFGAVLDLRDGRLSYCNCGHNPPLLQRKNGTIEILQQGGIALGVVTPAGCETWTTHLDTGDRVLFFTDGITEAHDLEGDLFGEERLCSSVRRHRELDADMLVEAIFGDVATFASGAPQHDDLTCLVLAYPGMKRNSVPVK
jgi:serine phosphatase RsbU (regulator of sigma subunit)